MRLGPGLLTCHGMRQRVNDALAVRRAPTQMNFISVSLHPFLPRSLPPSLTYSSHTLSPSLTPSLSFFIFSGLLSFYPPPTLFFSYSFFSSSSSFSPTQISRAPVAEVFKCRPKVYNTWSEVIGERSESTKVLSVVRDQKQTVLAPSQSGGHVLSLKGLHCAVRLCKPNPRTNTGLVKGGLHPQLSPLKPARD